MQILCTNTEFVVGQMEVRKTVVELADRRTFRMQMTSSQQSGIQTREHQGQSTQDKENRDVFYKDLICSFG